MSSLIRLKVKPLSVNEAYAVFRGRKLKSKKYRQYETAVTAHLIKQKVKIALPKKGQLYLHLKIGVSRGFDIDNAVKPFIDILQPYFNFNDNRISYLQVEKDVIKKGEEYIEFQLGANKK